MLKVKYAYQGPGLGFSYAILSFNYRHLCMNKKEGRDVGGCCHLLISCMLICESREFGVFLTNYMHKEVLLDGLPTLPTPPY